jgi:hypothetical protein
MFQLASCRLYGLHRGLNDTSPIPSSPCASPSRERSYAGFRAVLSATKLGPTFSTHAVGLDPAAPWGRRGCRGSLPSNVPSTLARAANCTDRFTDLAAHSARGDGHPHLGSVLIDDLARRIRDLDPSVTAALAGIGRQHPQTSTGSAHCEATPYGRRHRELSSAEDPVPHSLPRPIGRMREPRRPPGCKNSMPIHSAPLPAVGSSIF